MAVTDPVEITRAETRGSAALWFGLLAAPLAWTLQLLVNYSLEEWFACSPGSDSSGEILGLGVSTVAVGVTALLALLAAAGGLVAFSCHRRSTSDGGGSGAAGDTPERARWMALAGMFNSALYLLIIVASFGPPAILGVCETSP